MHGKRVEKNLVPLQTSSLQEVQRKLGSCIIVLVLQQ